MIKKLISLFLFVLLLPNIYGQIVNILLLETTDIHGSIFPYNFIEQKEINTSMANVFSYVNFEREKKGQTVYLFDAGDLLQGQPVAYYYNFEDTRSNHIFSKVMNYMKYDAATIGNHDIETGHSVYDRVTEEFNFPWLAANAINKETGKPYWEPYATFTSQGVKIAVLGLTTPGVPVWLPENLWQGIEFEDMIVSAKKWVDYISKNEKPDILVGLFHSGIDYTHGGQNAETPKNENASLLIAEQVEGFDIIFAGHDHVKCNRIVTNQFGNEVLLLNPSSHAGNVAAAKITLTKNEKENTWSKSISGELIDASQYKPDSAFISEFANEFIKVKEYVAKPIARLNSVLDSKYAYYGSSAFIDLIHKIQLEITKADISFAAPLTYHSVIDTGYINVSDMFKFYGFENLLYTMNLTGKEIVGYLEFSYSNWFNTMTDTSDFLFIYETDENNYPVKFKYPYYNFDSALGLIYEVDVTKPAGERINIFSMQNGDKFVLDKTYKVAINSYRGNGGGGHLTRGAGLSYSEISSRFISSTDKDLRYLMMKWLEEKEVINTEAANNWKVVPENFVDYRSAFEDKLLFSK